LNNQTAEIDEDEESQIDPHAYHWDPEVLAQHAMKFTNKDRDAFVRKLQDLGAETGFLEA